MLWVGLSGGIGSGKSTVSSRLAGYGAAAMVIDADVIAREVVRPGMPALAEISDRFGQEVVGPGGELDRAALGAIVFGDPQARHDLEAITHPRIAERTQELLAAAPQDAVVVHDIPLLVELDRAADYALTIIVDVPAEERLRRLVELRGMEEGEARRRIAAQADDEARRRAADVLLDNTGTVEELHVAVDRLWRERLVPFEDNLRHGRASQPAAGRSSGRGTVGAVQHDAAQLERTRERAHRALEGRSVDDPATVERLRRVGLLLVQDGPGGERVLRTADPQVSLALPLPRTEGQR